MAKSSRSALLLRVTVVGCFFAMRSVTHAAVSPLSVAIIPPVEFPPADFNIVGARASLLWGEHRKVYGFDLGVIGNKTTQDFVGVGVSGIFNYNYGTATAVGLQAAGLANININKAHIFGVQAALGVNSNRAESEVVGLQIAVANLSPFTKIYGVQAGIYNSANVVCGFQIGVVNVAESLHGLQIGLINFHNKGLFAVSPILNFGF